MSQHGAVQPLSIDAELLLEAEGLARLGLGSESGSGQPPEQLCIKQGVVHVLLLLEAQG